jgi:FKBP-type peptidyl-prolyl cis-trans isomerase
MRMLGRMTVTLLFIAVLIVSVLVVKDFASKKSDTSGSSSTPTAQQPEISPTVTNAHVTIEDLVVGTGKEAKSGDIVVVNYKGTLENGTQFDSSYDRGEPLTTSIGEGRVIKGWDEGIPGMKVGGKRKLTIPPELGYGDRDMGSIPPNSTLIFEVELVDVK